MLCVCVCVCYRSVVCVVGVSPLHGLLLYGLPGCGKTHIANTIGGQLQGTARFITLDAYQLLTL